jgi:hypothetical protein
LFLYEVCGVDGIREAIRAIVLDEDAKSEIINASITEKGIYLDGLEMVPPTENEIVHVGDIVSIDAKHEIV